jgi:hypothetical protein
MGELRLFQRKKGSMCGPTTLSGTSPRSGSGRPNSSRSSANPRQLLPDQLHGTALFSSAYSDGSYGNASRGEPILAPLGPSRPSNPERSFRSRGGRVMRLEVHLGVQPRLDKAPQASIRGISVRWLCLKNPRHVKREQLTLDRYSSRTVRSSWIRHCKKRRENTRR